MLEFAELTICTFFRINSYDLVRQYFDNHIHKACKRHYRNLLLDKKNFFNKLRWYGIFHLIVFLTWIRLLLCLRCRGVTKLDLNEQKAEMALD